ncbi:putative Tripeptidyl aminopeptidase (plasmid) [Streptomyces alboflavus]|uniref:Putative Tripeptidyl aminopeptidase n=1 Tax=Streptomyces alboflavus TaxID=67267 RepID=A0A291W4S4_9ACTN|nr:alpha/beta fold hydrolase [Streptomyces alboflavus]ATM24656.1 putative Tripeptidyl aminopeptidase [Streptomyces alboflavus]
MAHPARRRHLIPLAALSVTAALLPQLAAAPASAAPAPSSSTRQLAPHLSQEVAWRACGPELPGLQCATLKVPLDYAKPRGRQIDIAISRLQTSVPGKRRGIMALNPGGPGGPGLDFPLTAAKEWPRKVTDQYDLVGFDPRGVGESTPVSCGLGGTDLAYPRPNRTRAEFTANTAWSKKVAAACRDKAGDLLPHLTTRNTARDMDVMRSVLGEKKLNYFGISYGSAIGASYMQQFPERADRFVIDSAVDPTQMWRGMYRVWAPAAEKAFGRWTRWTAQHNATYHLGSTPGQVRSSFWQLVERAKRQPIELDGARYDDAGVRNLLRARFVRLQQSAELVQRLQTAAAEQHTSRGPATVPAAPADDNQDVSRWAVVCADSSNWPRDAAAYRRDVARDSARYPLYGDFASGISPCAYWPRAAETATPINNRVAALIVHNQWDPTTPLAAGQSMHRALKGSRMVTVRGGVGHSVRFYTDVRNACADRYADVYMATGKLPASDLTCQAAPQAGTKSAPAPARSGASF